MANYHIKRPRPFESGDVYYKSDGDQWTGTYADRKQFSTEAQANAQISNPTKMVNGFPTKSNGGFASATVVEE